MKTDIFFIAVYTNLDIHIYVSYCIIGSTLFETKFNPESTVETVRKREIDPAGLATRTYMDLLEIPASAKEHDCN